ncbi:MAG: hypothetical protein HGB05_04980 [Chloroflexi bacterium]|nr:hypothetical protein [Chloroflexota bacterium]
MLFVAACSGGTPALSKAGATPTALISPLAPVSIIPTPGPTPRPAFNGDEAHKHITAQTDLGPRPTGSEAGCKTGESIIEQLQRSGWQVETQEFEA